MTYEMANAFQWHVQNQTTLVQQQVTKDLLAFAVELSKSKVHQLR